MCLWKAWILFGSRMHSGSPFVCKMRSQFSSWDSCISVQSSIASRSFVAACKLDTKNMQKFIKSCLHQRWACYTIGGFCMEQIKILECMHTFSYFACVHSRISCLIHNFFWLTASMQSSAVSSKIFSSSQIFDDDSKCVIISSARLCACKSYRK